MLQSQVVDQRQFHSIAHAIPFDPPIVACGWRRDDDCSEETLQETDTLDPERRVFDIRVADGDRERDAAGILINRMYATRGYLSNGLSRRRNDRRITLVASEREAVVGTLTLGFDHAAGLLVDELFGQETDALRADGLKLCEFTKLAIDGAMRSQRLIASLFHAAYIFAHPLMDADRLLIEVNPRHVGYYRRMLGFQAVGAPRLNPRVDAPAVLMALDLEHARHQIDALGGTALSGQGQAEGRSLYPFFFSPEEEQVILMRAQCKLPSHDSSFASRQHPGRRRGDVSRAADLHSAA